MAKDKNSFILYCDSKELINQLPDDVAGRLFKHIFAYVNDENPESDELLLNVAFAPIKAALKRDLKSYESKKEERSRSGILGNLSKYYPDLYESVKSKAMSLYEAQSIAKKRKASHSDTNTAVSDSVNVSVSDSVNDTDKNKKTIEKRKKEFAEQVRQHISSDFDKDEATKFYNYWTEKNDKGRKMKFEKQTTFEISKRILTWISNKNEWKKEKISAKKEKTMMENEQITNPDTYKNVKA